MIISKIFTLILITVFAILHQRSGPTFANIHALCPFGGLESLYQVLAKGTFITKIYPGTIVLFGATILMALIINRGFCSWICPLGTLQFIFVKMGSLLGIKKRELPEKIDRYLKYFKYIFLIFILYFTYKTGTLFFESFDPWATYAHIFSGWKELFGEFLIGMIFLIVALFGSLFYQYNYCKYFCPMGACLALISKVSPTRIYRDASKCINCGLCASACPVHIKVDKIDTIIDCECLTCNSCIDACPVDEALYYKTIWKKPIKTIYIGLISIIIFWGSISLSKTLGIWKVSKESLVELIYDESSKLNPDLIRGSMSLNFISKSFGVPLSYYQKELGIDGKLDVEKKIKELGEEHNFEKNDIVRLTKTYISENQ